VDAARLGGGLFLQLNYRDGAEELPAFVWQPSDFAAALEEMRSPQFLTRLTQDRALDQIDALLSDAIVQGWQQKARGAGSYSLARPGMFPGAALRPRGSGSGLVGGR